MNNSNPRGWVYLGLFALGAVLVLTGLVKANELLDWFLVVALAASTAGNVLARVFLTPAPPEPRGIDPHGPNA